VRAAIGQYAVFQVGVFAPEEIPDLDVVFGDLKEKGGALDFPPREDFNDQPPTLNVQ
jgi:hypothetical protein